MNLNEMQQKDYRSIPFYSLNDELEEGRLREQIRFMHKQGIGGFFLHARGGLETEYLSEEWFRLMEAAVDEAKKLGMDVWFYDENGWPSGFAGGELLKEGNYVAYLELKEESAYSADAFASYVLVGQEYRRVAEEQGETVYYNIYVRYNHSYVDLLDPEVTRQFLRSTHEKYYERFKKEFGKTVAGFFTDEPQYFREALPWSKVILQQDNDVLRRVQRYMLERWAEHYEIIFSNAVLLEMTRKGSNKGGMVDYLVKYLGMDPKKVYCVGDNQNDIPMLARSAVPFAPSNCAQEVKDWGAYIMGSCEEGCVAQIIRVLDKLYE